MEGKVGIKNKLIFKLIIYYKDVTVHSSSPSDCSRKIWLSHLHCSGTENTLLECPRANDIGYTNCSHSQDVGVCCPGRSQYIS